MVRLPYDRPPGNGNKCVYRLKHSHINCKVSCGTNGQIYQAGLLRFLCMCVLQWVLYVERRPRADRLTHQTRRRVCRSLFGQGIFEFYDLSYALECVRSVVRACFVCMSLNAGALGIYSHSPSLPLSLSLSACASLGPVNCNQVVKRAVRFHSHAHGYNREYGLFLHAPHPQQQHHHPFALRCSASIFHSRCVFGSHARMGWMVFWPKVSSA